MTTVTIKFPKEELTPFPIESTPTSNTVNTLIKEIYSNAVSIPSPQGGGQHGHLGIVMPAADYLGLGGGVVPWVNPVDPGPLVAPGGAAAVIANATAAWEEEKRIFHTFVLVKTTIKNQILKAVPDVYLNALAHPMLGFANVEPNQMLAHLLATYGTITTEDLKENEALLTAPWDINQPTETVFDRAVKVQAFAQPHEPIADGTVVRKILEVFEQSGVLADACKDWTKKTRPQHVAKAHFGVGHDWGGQRS